MRLPKTKTDLQVKPRSPDKNSWVRFIIQTRQEQEVGYLPTSPAPVGLQARVDGRWVLLRHSIHMTDERGRAVLHYHFRSNQMRVRAKTFPTLTLLGSKTKAITIKAN